MLLIFLALTLGFVAASPVERYETPDASTSEVPALDSSSGLTRDEDTVNDMMREVAALITDTSNKLKNAAKEV